MGGLLLDRFTSDPDKRLLIEALARQVIARGDEGIARELASVVALRALAAGETLIEEGGADNDIYLILTGSMSVRVRGRHVAVRPHGQHVGEMAVINPAERRSASVVALEPSVVALIRESDFASLAAKVPELWRRLASELADRLRQRNVYVRPVNAQPVVFIGSSVEGLDVARAIQNCFLHDPFVVRIWTDRVFGASQIVIDELARLAILADYAILVLKPDDLVEIRGQRMAAPRDNVTFELGLFIGALGRDRCFLVYPRGVDIRIPTDLLGVVPLMYQAYREPEELAARVAPLCNEMRDAIRRQGPR